MRFFSDLDNTLIYSHRHHIREPKICVEVLHGKQQSYMSQKSYEYFQSQKWLNTTPVTTRTFDQYQRLNHVAKQFGWHSALICNGAILLIEGKEDIQWRKESVLLAENDQAAFEDLYRRAYNLYGKHNIVLVDQIMFYVKGTGGQDVYETLTVHSDSSHIRVLRDSRKTYCIPISLSKGNAIKRFLDRTGESFSVAAGDSSDFDISMADNASIFLCPEEFQKNPNGHSGLKKCKGLFADAICDELDRIRAGVMINDR